MTLKRIIYAILLIAAAAVFVFTDSGAALFLLCALALLPLVSLIVLAFARRRIVFDFDTRSSCIRGGALQISFRAGVRPRFLVGCVKVTLLIENTTFGKTIRREFMFEDLSFAEHTFDYVGGDSGRICVRVEKIRLIDVFGVCSLGAKCAKFTESFVSPVLYEGLGVNLGPNRSASLSGETSLPQKGNDNTEIFNIRDYEAGDAPNRLHWKLSGKFDSLKTKEFGSTDEHRTLILVDLGRGGRENSADDAALNAVLDVAVSVSDSLKEDGCAHVIGWFDGGAFRRSEVTDADSFVQAVYSLMSIKVDGGFDKSYLAKINGYGFFTKIIYVAAAEQAEKTALTPLGLTTIAISSAAGGGDALIYVPKDDVTALTGCVL